MAAIWPQVSSVAESDHTKPKPKLDDGDKDEAAETKDTLKSSKRGETTTGFDDDSSDDDFGAPRLCPQEDEELAELCDFALSLCETEHVSSVTVSNHTKPKLKLDDGDKDEAVETKDTLKSPKQGETGTGFDDDSSDDDCGYKVEAVEMNDTSKSAIRGETTTGFDDYSSVEEFGCCMHPLENGKAYDLCDFALSLHETQHPGECWKFKSMREAYWEEPWFCCTDDYYHLEFVGEKADGKSVRNFVVDVICSWCEGHEELTVQHCVLRKDDEVEPMDEYMKECVNMKIVKFCKSALTYYEELHSGEAYEFVKIQTMRRSVVGVIFVFHAKNKADDTLATFKAYNHHHNVLRTDIDVVGSFR